MTYLKKNRGNILKVTSNTTEIKNMNYRNISRLFTNGTFKLDKTTKKDAGDYQLEEYTLDGKLLTTINFTLQIIGKYKCKHIYLKLNVNVVQCFNILIF